MSGNISEAEKNALRFYIGDVSGNESFYSDPKAYVVLNSLFFPDIATESARASEGKYLNPDIIADIPRLMEFFELLFSVFRKSVIPEKTFTNRVERMADYELIRRRHATVSMTSTSTAGFLSAYQDRKGIALMNFIIPENTRYCVDVAEVLPDYAKPEEAEILLPPFMNLVINEEEAFINNQDISIIDSDGNPPQVMCTATVSELVKCDRDTTITTTELSVEGSEAGQRVYKALNNGEIPDKSDIELYSAWKTNMQNILNKMLM